MARKNKSKKHAVPHQAAPVAPAASTTPGAPASPVVVSPMRVLALGGMGLFIIAVFLWSFISRMSSDTRFEDRRPKMGQMGGQAGGMPMPEGISESMPPAMAEAMQKQRASQEGQQTPQGMPGQAMAGMDADGMNRVGAMMRQMQGDPNNATVLAMLADEFMHMQDWEAAVSFLNRALVAEPANARVMGLLGISHFNMKEYDAAVQYFESLLAVEPDNAGAHYNLGMIYTRFLNRPEEGRRRLEAMLLLPTVTDPLRREATALLEAAPPAAASPADNASGTGNASSS